MKTMTCKQLGGACDQEFKGDSFEEIARQSKQHGMEMFQKGDAAHITAMNAMRDKMKNPDDMRKWMEEKQREYEAMPHA